MSLVAIYKHFSLSQHYNLKRFIIYTFVLLTSLQLIYAHALIQDIIRLKEVRTIEYIPKNKVLGIQITNAILQKESGGNCNAKGASGERGCFQFMPTTYKAYIKKYLGTTTLPMTFENEYNLMVTVNTLYLEKGYTPYQVALLHNQGHMGKCSKGINKYGVKFDSCSYAQSIASSIK